MPKNALTIEKAKSWYETEYSSQVLMLKSASTDKKAVCVPDWEKATASNNEDLEVVEAPLLSLTNINFYTKESLELLKNNNEVEYLNSISRVIIQKNKKTGQSALYVMTIIGETDYLKTHKLQLANNTLLKKDKDFSGDVLFHNANGGFINGWQYKNGKVFKSISLASDNL